jgi:hypothetical protein
MLWKDLQATSSTHFPRSEDKWSPREDKRMVKLEFFINFFLFGHVLKIKNKNQHIHFLVHDHSSWSTSGLYLVRGPRLSKRSFLKSRTIEKGPLPWSDFMVHSVKRPLAYTWISWVWGITNWRQENYYWPFSRILENMPQINTGEPKDVSMWLVGLGNTKISTNYTPKSSRRLMRRRCTLGWSSNYSWGMPWRGNWCRWQPESLGWVV